MAPGEPELRMTRLARLPRAKWRLQLRGEMPLRSYEQNNRTHRVTVVEV